MISINNFIYTDNGIYRIDTLYNDIKENKKLPKLMTFDEVDKSFKFIDLYTVEQIPNDISNIDIDINKFNQIYECKFLDLFSNRTVTVNCNTDTSILQFNILKTTNNPIDEVKYGVIKYIKSNLKNPKLNLGWVKINSLINNSVYMPNMCLGDTLIKYINKTLKNKEISYRVFDPITNENIPIFICQNVENFYNCVLIKG